VQIRADLPSRKTGPDWSPEVFSEEPGEEILKNRLPAPLSMRP
jgi:hypothetical protein